MKKSDWTDLLRTHPLFGELEVSEIKALLDETISQEKEFKPRKVIIREGDKGSSLFVIGAGEVSVVLIRDGHESVVATLGEGEIFGEMAFFEERARSATIIAKTDCLLLEIDGKEFVKLLRGQPDLEFKFLSMLSERLRRVTDEILSGQLNSLIEKFSLLQGEVKHNLDLAKSSISAAEQTLDTTNKRIKEISERAKEVVESTERSQTNTFKALKIASGGGIVLLAMLSFFGWETWRDVKDDIETIEKSSAKAIQISKQIDDTRPLLDEMMSHAKDFRPKFYVYFVVRQLFREEINKHDFEQAGETFLGIMRLNRSDVSERLFRDEIMSRILNGGQPREYITLFLEQNLYLLNSLSTFDGYMVLYLLLASYVLDDELEKYNNALENIFEPYANENRNAVVKEKLKFKDDFAPYNFQILFENEVQKERLAALKLESHNELSKSEAVMRILNDPEIINKSKKLTDKIKVVWDSIP